ncbi:MAG: LPP20 family lipoprotein, partial [Thermodesulfobacteriota bacterium]
MKKLLLLIAVLFFAAPALAQQPPQVVTDPSRAFVTGAIVVKGEGAAPSDRPMSRAQKKIMALRAAKVIALRELAEIIDGVAIFGETTIVDAAAQSDTVRATVQGMVKGATVAQEGYDPVNEIAVVYLSMPTTGPNGLTGQLIPQVMSTIPPPTASYYQPQAAPPPSPPQAYDALILDITRHSFKPALINRVLAENGEVLYDPTKIAQEILVERGAGDYTNDVGKAKALLGERGARNPLVVSAAGVVKNT